MPGPGTTGATSGIRHGMINSDDWTSAWDEARRVERKAELHRLASTDKAGSTASIFEQKILAASASPTKDPPRRSSAVGAVLLGADFPGVGDGPPQSAGLPNAPPRLHPGKPAPNRLHASSTDLTLHIACARVPQPHASGGTDRLRVTRCAPQALLHSPACRRAVSPP